MDLPSSEGYFNLTEELIQSLRIRYPHTDVDKEVATMNLWLHRNPSRRWSRMLLGIEKWLKKAEAEQRQKGAKLHIVTNRQSEKWWESDQSTLAHGEKIGNLARPGETMADYRRRLRRTA